MITLVTSCTFVAAFISVLQDFSYGKNSGFAGARECDAAALHAEEIHVGWYTWRPYVCSLVSLARGIPLEFTYKVTDDLLLERRYSQLPHAASAGVKRKSSRLCVQEPTHG